jgi:hypothetical protein
VTRTTFLYNRATIVLAIVILDIFLLSRCIGNTPVPITNNKGEEFAGSASCINCHQYIYDSFVHTAHYLSSRVADSTTIKGSFKQGSNQFVFGNAIVMMEKHDTNFYQIEYALRFANYKSHYDQVNAARFDIVIGSNTKGQSYLYWNNDRLYQLPISYFTITHNWCNSPGYPFYPVYDRSITARCLECHSTYAKITSPPDTVPEQFDSRKIIYGIDCEKCHGAAAKHVAYQLQHPSSTTAKYIINPAKLSRQQNLDVCALCHSGGTLHYTSAPFSFQAGDTITNYFKADTTPVNTNAVDVHGNQYGVLVASRCFKTSGTMTCNTCHNTHDRERDNTVLFSQRCISCHNTQTAVTCPLAARLSTAIISKNCIDCHMPLRDSKVIAVSLPGDTALTAAKVRSHYISIYPAESQKILELMKKEKQHL